MAESQSRESLRDAFDAIIEGKIVKRSRHELLYNGEDLTALFTERLEHHRWPAMNVGDIAVEPGERVPAFFIEKGVAYFGWVFWEQFTSWKLRKLWGSVVKNDKGDWAIQIPATRPAMVYANPSGLIEMDIDHPPEF